jgi:hypothetical protein
VICIFWALLILAVGKLDGTDKPVTLIVIAFSPVIIGLLLVRVARFVASGRRLR